MSLSGEDWAQAERRSRAGIGSVRSFVLGAVLSLCLFAAAASYAAGQMSRFADEQRRSRQRAERQDKATLQILKVLDPDHAVELERIMKEAGK